MITEFDLIEIANQFRVLEDAVAKVDLELATIIEGTVNRVERQRLDTIRDNVDVALERHRDNMTAMQNCIRRGGE